MNKPLFFIFLIIGTLISCSSESTEENDDNTSTENKLLLPETFRYKNQENNLYEFSTYVYTEGNKLKSIINEKYNSSVNYTYTENNITKIEALNNDEANYTVEIWYNPEGERIVKIKEIDHFDNETKTYNYEYISSNQVVEYLVYDNENYTYESLYTFENENRTTIKTDNYLKEYYFDSQNNIHKNILGFDKLIFETGYTVGMTYGASENIIKFNGYNKGELIESSTIEYIYNDEGYPIEATSNYINTDYDENFTNTFYISYQ